MSFHKDLVGTDLHGSKSNSGTGSPVGVVTPGVVGEHYFDTTSKNEWVAFGLVNTNWQLIGGGMGGLAPVTAVGTVTTTSLADVLTTGMTITPPAGMYRASFTGSAGNFLSAQSVFLSLYAGGVKASESERVLTYGVTFINIGGGFRYPFTCTAEVIVNGSQAIEGRWRVSGGTGSMVLGRVLSLERVA